jgi:hypothetical protein
MTPTDKSIISQAMSILGRKGGSVSSEAKTRAVRENARKTRRRRKCDEPNCPKRRLFESGARHCSLCGSSISPL